MRYIYILNFCFLLLIHTQGQNNTHFAKFGTGWSDDPHVLFIGFQNEYIVASGSYSYLIDSANTYLVRLDSMGVPKGLVVLGDSIPHRYFLGGGILDSSYYFLSTHSSSQPPYSVVFSILITDCFLTPIKETLILYNDTMRPIFVNAIRDSRGYYEFCGRIQKPGGSTMPYLVKIDSLGNIKEQQFDVFPGYQFGINARIIEDHTSNGYFLGSQNKNGGGGERILHLDSNFNILSDTVRYPYYMYWVCGLKKQNPDRIIVTSNIITTNGNLVLAAFDTTGRMLHFLERTKPGYWLDEGYDPLAVTDSSIFFATYHCIPGDMVFPPIHNNIFVQKLDTAFQVLWEAELGWDAYFRLSNIMATPDGGCMVLASVYDSDTMYLQHDVVLFKLDGNGKLIGVTNLTPKPEALTISPNPGQHQFELHGANNLQRIEVFDTGGRLVKSKTLNGEPTIISMEGESAGLYLIKGTDAAGRTYPTLKWVKRE